MSFVLGKKSLSRLDGVHKDLANVVRLAITLTKVDFSVIEGIRTKELQMEYLRKGVSKTVNSRHLTGHAVDIYPWVAGKTSHSTEHYKQLSDAMFEAAKQLNVVIEWGGNFKSFIDKPHWQLPRSVK